MPLSQLTGSPTALKLPALCVCCREAALIASCIQSLLNELIVHRCLLLCFQGDFERKGPVDFLPPSPAPCSLLNPVSGRSCILLERAKSFHVCSNTPLLLPRFSPLCIRPALEEDSVGLDGLVNIINDASRTP